MLGLNVLQRRSCVQLYAPRCVSRHLFLVDIDTGPDWGPFVC